jgi:hypothetical protein
LEDTPAACLLLLYFERASAAEVADGVDVSELALFDTVMTNFMVAILALDSTLTMSLSQATVPLSSNCDVTVLHPLSTAVETAGFRK